MRLGSWAKTVSPGDPIGSAVYVGSYGSRLQFTCGCGGIFTRSINSDLTEDSTFVCKECRARKVQNVDWGYRVVFQKMRHKASLRGIDFDLTVDDLKELISQPCHYCKAEGVNAVSNRSRGIDEFFNYNGLDRVDSNGHYTRDNVLPCCPICNRAKGSVSYGDFMAWIDRLARMSENACSR